MKQFGLRSLFALTAIAAVLFYGYAYFAPSGPYVTCQDGITDAECEKVMEWSLITFEQREIWDTRDTNFRILRIDGQWGVIVTPNPPTPGIGVTIRFDDDGKLLDYSPTI